MEEILVFFKENYIELLGAIISLIYLYFSIKQNILLWFFGIISSALYIYIFGNSKLYADMSLQVYYVIISLFGWYNWYNKKLNTQKELAITSILKNKKLIVYLILITFIQFIIISFILKKYTDSDIFYLDALTTALGITATWMLAKKMIEHWLIWIVVNPISFGLYIYKELYFTVFLYLVYSVLAIVGYFAWKKEISYNSVFLIKKLSLIFKILINIIMKRISFLS